jgi:hypothetical protein
MEPEVRELTCPQCGKPVKVRCLPDAPVQRFQCPHCKGIQDVRA